MSNVISLSKARVDRSASKFIDLMSTIRNNTIEMYETLTPHGFKTRKRTPIEDMNVVQLDSLMEEMVAFLRERGLV